MASPGSEGKPLPLSPLETFGFLRFGVFCRGRAPANTWQLHGSLHTASVGLRNRENVRVSWVARPGVRKPGVLRSLSTSVKLLAFRLTCWFPSKVKLQIRGPQAALAAPVVQRPL